MHTADGLTLAWKLFITEALQASTAAVAMGADPALDADLFAHAEKCRDAIHAAIDTLNKIVEEMQQWKLDGTFDDRIKRLQAIKMGILSADSTRYS